MSKVDLSKSIDKLNKSYLGKDKEGNYVLSRTVLKDELGFSIALDRAMRAIENKEITEKQLIDRIKKKRSKK